MRCDVQLAIRQIHRRNTVKTNIQFAKTKLEIDFKIAFTQLNCSAVYSSVLLEFLLLGHIPIDGVLCFLFNRSDVECWCLSFHTQNKFWIVRKFFVLSCISEQLLFISKIFIHVLTLPISVRENPQSSKIRINVQLIRWNIPSSTIHIVFHAYFLLWVKLDYILLCNACS